MGTVRPARVGVNLPAIATRISPAGSILDQAERVAAEAASRDWLLLSLGPNGSTIAYCETLDRERLHRRLLAVVDRLWHDSALVACAAGVCDCHCRKGGAA